MHIVSFRKAALALNNSSKMNKQLWQALYRPSLRAFPAMRSFSSSALHHSGYSEVSYMPEDDSATPQFSFAEINGTVSSLKTMLKTNPTDLDKNNARRSLSAIAKHASAVPQETITYEPIDPKQIVLILHAVFHTISMPNPAGKAPMDISPIYAYLENVLWSAGCASWAPADMAEVLRICGKISNVPIVSVLAALVRPCISIIEKLKPSELVLVARAFHSVGIQHPELHEGILKESIKNIEKLSTDEINRILTTMIDRKVPEADRQAVQMLFEKLMEKATKSVKSLSAPIASRCLRNIILCEKNFPVLFNGIKEKFDAFQTMLHGRSLETISCAPVQDVVEICANFAALLDKERFQPIFKLTTERVISLAQNLKPRQIAKLFHSCAQHNILDEQLLNILAEKSCAQMSTFDECDMADVVESLAGFDLYDAELFTMVATRFAQKTREREVLDQFAVTRVLQAFGKLKEKNDALLFACAQQCILSLYSLERVTMERTLAVFKQFDFNHRDITVQLETRLSGVDEKSA